MTNPLTKITSGISARRFPHTGHLLQSMMLAVVLIVLSSHTARAATTPQEVVKGTTDRLLDAMKSQRQAIDKNPDVAQELVRKILLPVVDVELVSRGVLGKYWHRATPQQQQRFIDEFRTLLIRTYSAPLLKYRDFKVEYLPGGNSSDSNYATVRTRIVPEQGQPVRVDYRLRKVGDNWRVYDVMVEGISTLITFRNEYYSVIQNVGLDRFLEQLAQKNQQLRSGQTPTS